MVTTKDVPSARIALSWRDVLAMIPLSRRALQIKIARREFPKPIPVGGKVLFDRDAVLAWWEKMRGADGSAQNERS